MSSLQVTIHPGPRLHRVLPMSSEPVSSLRREYGSLECCIEIVDNVSEAIDHINNHGSHHTDCVITENGVYMYVYTFMNVCVCVSCMCMYV